ncbi:MAG TPA: SRPBCC family protein [Burkholderiaceae bacterium]|nr:SRPBCC family protein [Burkholderiaceae bacterium]
MSLGAMVALSAAAPAAERAVSVVETVQLAVAPARVWAATSDFSAWQAWHPAFATTKMVRGDGHTPGSVRVLVAKDGGRFTEELVAFDAAARSYQYRIIESPAPVKDYVSTVQIKERRGGSTVVWSSQFNVASGTSEADAKKLISSVYRAGLDNLASVTAD